MNKLQKLLFVAFAVFAIFGLPAQAWAIDQKTLHEAETSSKSMFWAQSRKAAVLGDSFQSGYGGAPYFPDSTNAQNQCLRSTTAPAVLADQMWWVPVTLNTFKACAGAVTDNIIEAGQYNEPPQIAALASDTQVVSVQIGGNDVQFGSLVNSCIFEDCVLNGHMARSSALVDELGAKLDAVFRAIKQKAPQAKKPIAFGYPQLLPIPGSSVGPGCPYMNEAERTAGFALMIKLNAAVREAAMRNGFIYGEFNVPKGPFEGHDICATESFFYAPDQGFLHPNTEGRKAMANFQALYMTYAALAK